MENSNCISIYQWLTNRKQILKTMLFTIVLKYIKYLGGKCSNLNMSPLYWKLQSVAKRSLRYMEGIGFSIFIRQKPQFCKDVSSFPINHQILHNHNQSQQDLGGRFGQIISRISMEKDKRRFSCRTRQEWVYNIRYHETTVMNVGIGKNTQTIME